MARGRSGKDNRVIMRMLAKGKTGYRFNGGDQKKGKRTTKKDVKSVSALNIMVSEEIQDTKIKTKCGLLTGDENPQLVALTLAPHILLTGKKTCEFNDYKNSLDGKFKKAYETLNMNVQFVGDSTQ